MDSSSQSDIVQASKKQKLVDEVVVTCVGRVPGLGTVPEGLGASECSSVEPDGYLSGTTPFLDVEYLVFNKNIFFFFFS